MFSSWMSLMASLTNDIEAVRGVECREETERQALVVEERSCVAHLVRKIRNAAKGKKMVDSDDDDDASIAKAHAQGSSLLFKFKLVAERRQIEWDLYEARCRELRRNFEATNDPALFDAVEALPAPGHHSKHKHKQQQQQQRQTALVVVHKSVDPPAEPASNAVLLAPLPSKAALPHPPAVIELPPAVKQAMQEEGFARASILLEERASRRNLSNTFKITLIEGDDEMRARTWNRESNDAEVARREERRDEEAAEKRAAAFREMSNRHKSIAIEQTQRVFLKKMLRERRVSMQVEETQLREEVEAEWAKWFNISIVLRNFRSLLTIVPLEEAASRGTVIGKEWNQRQCLILRLWRFYQRIEASYNETLSSMDQLFDTETFMMRYQIEMHDKTVREQEEELKRRDVLRDIADAEERERIILEAKYGASPLTERPDSANGRTRLILRPKDELEIIQFRHPPSGITDIVRQTFRSNQENNSLFMALEPKYMKAKKHVTDAPLEASPSLDTASNSSPFTSSRRSTTASPTASSRVRPPQLAPSVIASETNDDERHPPRSSVVAVVSPKLDAIRQFQPDAPVIELRAADPGGVERTTTAQGATVESSM
jgi:hypothetical protein